MILSGHSTCLQVFAEPGSHTLTTIGHSQSGFGVFGDNPPLCCHDPKMMIHRIDTSPTWCRRSLWLKRRLLYRQVFLTRVQILNNNNICQILISTRVVTNT